MKKYTFQCLLCGTRSIQKRICETWTIEMKIRLWQHTVFFMFLSKEGLIFIYVIIVCLQKLILYNYIVNCLLIVEKLIFYCIIKYSLLLIFSFDLSDSRWFLEINENSRCFIYIQQVVQFPAWAPTLIMCWIFHKCKWILNNTNFISWISKNKILFISHLRLCTVCVRTFCQPTNLTGQ